MRGRHSGGLTGIESITYEALLPELRAEDAALLKVVLSGGVWCGEYLFAASQVDSPCCPFCDCPCETLSHMWYECRHVQDLVARDDLLRPGVLAALPKALINYGLCPLLPVSPHGSVWGGGSGP